MYHFYAFSTGLPTRKYCESEAFIEILSADSNPRVIDVGGNIGWYSLLSASNGAKVDVFEPNEFNYLRTCESICINNWMDESCGHFGDLSVEGSNRNGRVSIYPVGVGRQEEIVAFDTGSKTNHNPGQGKIIRSGFLENKNTIKIVPLDLLASRLGWYSTDISILKVDVEGFEYDVFQGARKFLNSKSAKNIFMEGNVGSSYQQTQFKELVQLLDQAGYRIYRIGGFAGPTESNVPPMGDDIAEKLTNQCSEGKNKKRSQCNLWWKVK